jgi:hypothetical protein
MLAQSFAEALAVTWKEVRSGPRKALGDSGILKIGKALGVGTGTVQRVLMEQSGPFDVGVAEVYTFQ